MSGQPVESGTARTAPGPSAREPRRAGRSLRSPGHPRPGSGRDAGVAGDALRTAVSRLARWPLARRGGQCPSRAPVAYMDGLSIHDLYRWQRRCELPTGHAGQHRGDDDSWG